ncbi:MAG: hypothetical protein FJX77_14245, partial [Armatimonadetes bacterium]|nr:hypothetical protein [Armatimonadota bacterium]
MDRYRRLAAFLIGLALFGAGAFVLCAANGVLPSSQISALGWLRSFADQIQQFSASQPITASGGGFFAVVLGFVLCSAATRTGSNDRALVVQKRALGTTSVSLLGLRRLAQHIAEEVPGVDRVTNVEALLRKNRVWFRCVLIVRAEADVLQMEQELRSRLTGAIQHHFGQPASETRVDVHTRVASADLARKR